MTTLSKEDVVRWADECVFDIMQADEYHAENEVIDSGNRWITDKMMAFATIARAALVAENERLKRSNSSYANLTKAQEGQLASLHLRLYELKGADKSIDSERAANATLTEELTATRTALAAAEADNERLRKALNKILTTDWVSDRVRRTAKAAIAQPRDDSALREMIAGVYEECAKVCDLFEQKADALNDSIADDDDANKGRSEYIMGKATASSRIANAIRALAEKAKGG